MAGSGVDLQIDLSLALDPARLAVVTKQIEQSLNSGLGSASTNAAQGLGKVEKQMDDIYASTMRAAKATEKLSDMGWVNDMQGGLGDLSDAVGLLGHKFLGINEKTQELIENTLSLAEKGFGLGGAFGPVGALVGGAAGAVAGLVKNVGEYYDTTAKKQEKLNAVIEASIIALNEHEAAIRENAKAWEDYGLATRRAGVTQISGLEGLLAVEEELWAKEDAGRQARLKAFQDNADKLGKIELATGSKQAGLDHIENMKGVAKVEAEIQAASIKRAELVSVKLDAALRGTFNESEKSTLAFNKALSQLGQERTLEKIAADVEAAEKALTKAEGKVGELRGALAEPARGGATFLEYMKTLKIQLIDSAIAASALSEAQADVLRTKGEKIDKEKDDTEEKEREKEDRIRKNKEAQQRRNEQMERIAESLHAQADATRSQAQQDFYRQGLEAQANFEKAQEKIAQEADKIEEDRIKKRDAQLQKDADASYEKWLDKRVDAIERAAKQSQDLLQAEEDLVADFNVTIEGYIGGKGISAINSFYDGWANKEKLNADDRKRRRAEFLRDTGDFLMTDGLKHILAGTADSFAGKPGAVGEIGAGIVEAAAGAAMGGAGAIAQRGLGGTSDNPGARGTGGIDGGPRVSNIDNAAQGTQNLPPIVIYLGGGPGSTTIHTGDTERGKQEAAEIIEDILHTNYGPRLNNGGARR